MKTYKKFLGITLSAAMMLSVAAPAFASDGQGSDPADPTSQTDPSSDPSNTDPAGSDDDDDDDANSSNSTTGTTATGSLLAYNVETVVVPTTMKLALNPAGYDLILKYKKTEDTTVNSDHTYYTLEADGTYKKVSSPVAGSLTTYYEADGTSDDQIVSLNYGIASKATRDKNVRIDFALEYAFSGATNKKPIEFVDSENKTEAYAAATEAELGDDGETVLTPADPGNPDGAKAGELKMYLAVGSAKNNTGYTTPEYYFATEDDTKKAGTTYYTESSGTYTAVGSEVTAFTAGTTYYEKASGIGPHVTADALGDVTMTEPDASSYQSFVEGTSENANKKVASTSIAFKLPKATYAAKAGENIDFNTTQANLGSKLRLATVSGYTGFTINGALNTNADWTTADADSISITPTYTITDSDGSETAVANTLNQITVAAAEEEADPDVEMTVSASGLITISNLSSTKTFTNLTVTWVDGTPYAHSVAGVGTWSPSAPTASTEGEVTFQLVPTWVTGLTGHAPTVTLTYMNDGETDTIVVDDVTIGA